MSSPFATAAPEWRAKGWQGTIQMPAKKKWPPPSGFTGGDGGWPDDDQVRQWAKRHNANIAIRLPLGVVGIDVDNYDGKPGLAALAAWETAYGPLPATWYTTSRTDGSRLMLFRVPESARFDHDVASGCIERIWHGHRYVMIPPSYNPDSEATYKLFGPDGVESVDFVPAPDDLPELPKAWLEQLTDPHRNPKVLPGTEPEPEPPPRTTPPRSLNGYRFEMPEPPKWIDEVVADYNQRTTWGDVIGHRFVDLGKSTHKAGATWDLWRHVDQKSSMGAKVNTTTDRLMVFSATAGHVDGWEIHEGGPAPTYDRFSAHCMLEEKKNDTDTRTKVARELRKKGYGPPDPADDWKDRTRQTADNDDGKSPSRFKTGAQFILDDDPRIEPVWGDGDEVLWATGESLILGGGVGAGKTTLTTQLVAARLGIIDTVLGWPVTPSATRVLYLAMDRPNQIRRAMRRPLADEAHRDALERLEIWTGPPPRDIAREPTLLLQMANEAGADTVFIDSLKDAANKLSDDDVGGGINTAMQHCVANGVEVVANHHARKAQGENKRPNTLDDLYGSRWITSGAGSVLFLFGQPGDTVVELLHLKQPSAVVGPYKVEHDHDAGTSQILDRWDPLQYLAMRGDKGATVSDAAQAMTGKLPTQASKKKAERELERLVKRHPPLAVKQDAVKGGAGGTRAARYWLPEHRIGVG